MSQNTILEYDDYQNLKNSKEWKPSPGLKVKLKNGAIGEYNTNDKGQLVFRIKSGVKDMKKIRKKALQVRKQLANSKKNLVVEKIRKIYFEDPKESKYIW